MVYKWYALLQAPVENDNKAESLSYCVKLRGRAYPQPWVNGRAQGPTGTDMELE